jgi:uncharacterized integral membrane protein
MGIRSSEGVTFLTDREVGSPEELGIEQSPTSVAPAPDGESTPTPNAVSPRAARRSGSHRGKSVGQNETGVRHTRISGAWAAVAVTTVLGVALVDFIVENTRSVEIHFFSVDGRLSVAAALLAAALAGAAVVLAIGVARTAQLRLSIRHRRHANDAVSAASADDRRAGPDSGPR